MFCGCCFLCMCHQVEKVNCLFKRNIFAEKADNVCWNFFCVWNEHIPFVVWNFRETPQVILWKDILCFTLFPIDFVWNVRWGRMNNTKTHTEITLKAVILQMFIFTWSGEYPMWLSRKLSDCNNNHKKTKPKNLKGMRKL